MVVQGDDQKTFPPGIACTWTTLSSGSPLRKCFAALILLNIIKYMLKRCIVMVVIIVVRDQVSARASHVSCLPAEFL